MATINVYLTQQELYGLLMEADKESQRVAPFIRQLLRDWLRQKGYEVD